MSQLPPGFVAISRCEFVFFQITLLLSLSKNQMRLKIHNPKHIFPYQWFDGQAEEAAGFYCEAFQQGRLNHDKISDDFYRPK